LSTTVIVFFLHEVLFPVKLLSKTHSEVTYSFSFAWLLNGNPVIEFHDPKPNSVWITVAFQSPMDLVVSVWLLHKASRCKNVEVFALSCGGTKPPRKSAAGVWPYYRFPPQDQMKRL